MNESLFFIILSLFLLGGIGIYLSEKRSNALERKKNWVKYFIYLFIITSLLACIYLAKKLFPLVCLLIIFAGLFEIIRLQKKASSQRRIIFYSILFVYLLISVLFFLFSSLSQTVLLFTLFTVCSFDAFCQITGRLFGKRKICPQLSPNKTVEGLVGGIIISIGIFFIVGKIMNMSISHTIVMGLGICLLAFFGDLSASWIKRRYGVKDFSSALPGHGGFLDRFDSFIVSGAFVKIFSLFIQVS